MLTHAFAPAHLPRHPGGSRGWHRGSRAKEAPPALEHLPAWLPQTNIPRRPYLSPSKQTHRRATAGGHLLCPPPALPRRQAMQIQALFPPCTPLKTQYMHTPPGHAWRLP